MSDEFTAYRKVIRALRLQQENAMNARQLTISKKGKQAILRAFDALTDAAICDPAGHGRGRTMLCAVCRAANGDPHAADCGIGIAWRALGTLVPQFFEREKWLDEFEGE